MRVIQAGVGGWGRHWVDVLSGFRDIELVALVDVDPLALAAAGRIGGLGREAWFGSLDEALETAVADVLVCVTPPALHRAHVTAGLAAGLDVIVEKPLALTMRDGQAIAAAAERHGRLVAVAQNYRYRPATWTMAQLVREGAIGKLGQVRLDFYKGWHFADGDFRRRMDDVLLADMAIHHFDLLRFISGQDALTVHGRSWNPPWSDNAGDTSANLTFTLGNGAHFVYNASWAAQGDFADWNGNWLIEGDGGSITYSSGELVLRRALGDYQAEIVPDVHSTGPAYLDQAAVVADMIAARAAGRQPSTSVRDNLNSLAMVLAAVEAVRNETGQQVNLAALR
jgi:predicted dehydrogenase